MEMLRKWSVVILLAVVVILGVLNVAKADERESCLQISRHTVAVLAQPLLFAAPTVRAVPFGAPLASSQPFTDSQAANR